jgi:ArsR family transcriptional regulator
VAPRQIELQAPTAVSCCVDLDEAVLSAEDAANTARLFKALADTNRVRLVHLLSTQAEPTCVCDLAEAIGVTQPTVSHHLRVLWEAGLVAREHNGSFVYYEVDRSALSRAAGVLVREEAPS